MTAHSEKPKEMADIWFVLDPIRTPVLVLVLLVGSAICYSSVQSAIAVEVPSEPAIEFVYGQVVYLNDDFYKSVKAVVARKFSGVPVQYGVVLKEGPGGKVIVNGSILSPVDQRNRRDRLTYQRGR